MIPEIPDGLTVDSSSKILLLVLDGLGGIPYSDELDTALAEAETPNLDRLATQHCQGLMDPVEPGVIPGSPAGHLGLFGYKPQKYLVGRGVLSALGTDFELRETDVACRVNFCTVDDENVVVDRRAGRISTEENQRLCRKIREEVSLSFDGEYFFQTVSEHRALFVIRHERAGGNITDTDPHRTGESPSEPEAHDESSAFTVSVIQEFLQKVRSVLSDEEPANMILTRGYDRFEPVPDFSSRFGVNGFGIAQHPMYKGVARYVGMSVPNTFPENHDQQISILEEKWDQHNFFFYHVKKTDSYGEDGDFEKKRDLIEKIDEYIPRFEALGPGVLAITADHSTPAKLRDHSWHPVPLLIRSDRVRRDRTNQFSEQQALSGSLGRFPSYQLMSILLANAGRVSKFGP